MSRHMTLLVLLGIACVIDDVYPKFDPWMKCADWRGDISLTTFKWNTSMSSREFQESYCPLRCFNGTLVSIHNVDSKCPRLNCFDCSCKRPECEHYGICCPDFSVPYHQLPGVESTFSQELDLFYINNKQLMTEMKQDINNKQLMTEMIQDINNKQLVTEMTQDINNEQLMTEIPQDINNKQLMTEMTQDINNKQLVTEMTQDINNKQLMTEMTQDINNKQLMTEMTQDINSHTTPSTSSDRKPPTLGCHFPEFGHSFLYIKSCPSDFAGPLDTIRLCEEDVPASELTIDDYAWAVDDVTNVVYRNVHCATCNGAVKPSQVPLSFSCPDYMPMYEITDRNKMMRLALDPRYCCDVNRDLPRDVGTFACDGEQFDTGVVSSCDVSHPARAYDTDVTKACADLNETLHRVFSRYTQTYYKNIFCAICHTNSSPVYSSSDNCQCFSDTSHEVVAPFSLLISFGQSSSMEESVPNLEFVDERLNCSTGEWLSPDGSCLPLKCSPGKLLVGGHCTPAIAEINGLKYNLKLWLRPDFNNSFLFQSFHSAIWTVSDLRQNLRLKIKTLVANLSSEYLLDSGCLHDIKTGRHTNSSVMEQMMICWLYGDIVARAGIPRDVFEFQVINHLLSGEIDVELDQENLIFFRPLAIAGKFEDCQDIGGKFGFACEMNEPLLAFDVNLLEKCPLPSRRPIHITGLLNCPYVSFNPSYYNVTVEQSEVIPHVTVTVDLNVTTMTISDWSDLNMLEVDEDDILNVCLQVLDSRLQPMGRDRRKYLPEVTNEKDSITFAQYVTTLVCLTCSMICLVLALVTYLRFPSLQTSAGQNNVCLCLSLLLAQAALIAASHRPCPIGLCKAVGLLTHFLWLWMFSWTFICSFHMFRVFTAKTRHTACSERDGRKQLIKRIACSLMGPVVIVVSVVVGSLISSDGETIGYGQDACYLDSVLLIGVSMVAPLIAIILCNMAFFTVTVCTVHNIRKLQSPEGARKDDFNQIFVYTKLSSITGACWVTTIIAEAVDVDVFRFISLFLNGFQGVFIFISYICNKRVLSLYTPRMDHCQRSSASSRTVVTSVPPTAQLKDPDLQKSHSTDEGPHTI